MNVMDRRKRIAGRLRSYVEGRGKTHKEVASVLNVDRSTVSNYLNGTRPIAAEDLWQMADYLAVPIAGMFEDVDALTAAEVAAASAVREMPVEYRTGAIRFLEAVVQDTKEAR